MNINQFPKDVQDFIHELCAKAIIRAVKKGEFRPKDQNEKAQPDAG
ncbi:hypothetical protein HUB98_13305 [Paenibacillus barcinonensis]|uniref:Uncharacterized protein n=1 Tax=Paenibacillus barcinonensis TaxID=198119 RepID=A0A2V4UQJ4_PAEBA|nr:hypothetical protein [Paenibacillus barcinonensis]PYE42353.1 hypothetical protein DFQ00_1381 [Paenibacillus barcinonensis]QKS57196.1 hypothetical protein HUB98_13305 [Paenibacillus barcinonensis]